MDIPVYADVQCADGKTISPLTGPETEPCAQTHEAECRAEPWTT